MLELSELDPIPPGGGSDPDVRWVKLIHEDGVRMRSRWRSGSGSRRRRRSGMGYNGRVDRLDLETGSIQRLRTGEADVCTKLWTPDNIWDTTKLSVPTMGLPDE